MTKRITVPQIMRLKGQRPVVSLTAYTASLAALLDDHVDFLLVGDSMGMVLYGMPNTLSVTVEMMIAHGAAVVRGSKKACVIVDMPFGSYQASSAQAFENAARIMAETGCAGVKLEGGAEMAETISFLVERGIPVLAHVGLLPQHANTVGGFLTQRNEEKILADAHAVTNAGAFAVVIECTEPAISKKISGEIAIPTIGIGAGVDCDGQILVTEDMIGQGTGYVPSFVKRYAEVHEDITRAARDFAEDVMNRRFPAK
ncbi:3-methyl-2-oxobutanoate hydroxymethyltransferase [Kiloniella laminariae]|uniref:3-methyl-2-oxobutanoate hydroxymethyltransferase n=1 Tax=Kiloniella laminariae TaxID=454162 RepID=UPI00036EA264|nr:3-methyl-2-oxobutanoate hydroxymethyltransferase [Kiloniella laminariae]